MELTQDFLSQFSEVIGSRWPLLASLLSFSTAEIEEIKRGVTGVPSIKAAAMLSRWREKQSPTPTYGLLKCKVTIASHVYTHKLCSNFAALKGHMDAVPFVLLTQYRGNCTLSCSPICKQVSAWVWVCSWGMLTTLCWNACTLHRAQNRFIGNLPESLHAYCCIEESYKCSTISLIATALG